MVYRTFGDLKTQVEAELDTQDEAFVGPAEMQSYFNSGINLCEALIVKLGLREQYLKNEAFISTVAGTTDYALPADLVINKLRKVIYRNGTLIYTMNPLKGEDSYVLEDVSVVNPPNEYYHYSLYKTGNIQIFRITPRAYATVTNAIRLVYFKQLLRYTADSVVCDLPDVCYEYLLSYVRYRVYAKEGHSNTPDEKQNMQVLASLLQETLQNQIADPTMDEMDGDMSHYEEMV